MSDDPEKAVFSLPVDWQRMICEPGRTVFEQGGPAHQAYFIEAGRVEVIAHDGAHSIKLAEIGPGEIFGEMGTLENRMRQATVRAIEKSTIVVIKKQDLIDRIDAVADPVIRSLINVLMRRLRDANTKQMGYYRELADFQDHVGNLVAAAGSGIDPGRRAAFTAEITPLLQQIEVVLKKYQ